MKFIILYDSTYIKKRVPTARSLQYADFAFKKVSFKNAPRQTQTTTDNDKITYLDLNWLSKQAEGYDGVVAMMDGNAITNSTRGRDTQGTYDFHNGKHLLQVECQEKLYVDLGFGGGKNTKKKTPYPQIEYSLDHEMGHMLCKVHNKLDSLHSFVTVNAYEKWWDFMNFPTKSLVSKEQPLVRRQADSFIKLANTFYPNTNLRITSFYRSFEEQDKLYAQAPKVTNAKGGESMHNYGVAFDVVDRKRGYDLTDAEWKRLARLWTALTDNKGSWGGEWFSFPDRPHFENTLGYSLKDFQTNKIDYEKFK